MKSKVFISFAISALSLTACNTGNVQVDNGSAAGATPAVTSPAPIAAGPVTTSPTTPTTSPPDKEEPTATQDDTVYFERIQEQNSLPFNIIAIGFMSTQSSGASPFGISLKGIQPFSSRPIFVPGQNEVTYLRTVDVGMDALLSTSLDALDTQQLMGFPSQVKDFSIDSKQASVAWLSDDGGIFVSHLSDSSMQTLDTSSFPTNVIATEIQTNPAGTQLLALVNNGTGYLYKNKNKTSKDAPSLIANMTAAAFSPDGTQLVYLNSSAKALHVIELDSLADTKAGDLESDDIHDLSWSISGGISYWARLASGQKEIRTLNAGVETTITQLTLPDAVGEGVVCPSWKDGIVYFANYYAGAYAIEKTDTGQKQKKTAPIAQISSYGTMSSSEGFVCPKVQ
jgi:hypothetical protein